MKACPSCDDGSGDCVYPYYGLAPHQHLKAGDCGLTKLLPKEDWPKNFEPDINSEGMGAYTHCEACGAG